MIRYALNEIYRFLYFVVGCVCAVATSTTQENFRLHIETYKNGKPFMVVTVKNSEMGSLKPGNLGNVFSGEPDWLTEGHFADSRTPARPSEAT